MKYYAYLPNKDGTEPMGTDRKILFQLKTNSGAIRRAVRRFGHKVRIFTYRNFYAGSTYQQIYGNKNQELKSGK